MIYRLFKISFLRRIIIKRQAGRQAEVVRRSSFLVTCGKKEKPFRMLLRTTTTTTTPTLRLFRFPTILISRSFKTTTTNYTTPHPSEKTILKPEDLSISAGENPQLLTKQATALLLPPGKWKLTKNKTGIERNFRFKTFKTTWVCKQSPPPPSTPFKNNALTRTRIRIT